MNSRTQAPPWGWTWLLLGALALAACGVAPEPPEEEAWEESVSAMHDDGGGPSPAPTWSEPSFSAAWTDNRFLVVWSDARFGGFKLLASRVRSDGRVLDPDGIRVSDSAGWPRTVAPSPSGAIS